MNDRTLASAFCFFLSFSYCMVTSAVPADDLLKKFGKSDQLNAAQTEKLFESIGIADWSDNGPGEESCSSSQYFHREYSNNDGYLNKTDLDDFCPAVMLELSKESCQRKAEHEEEEEDGNEDAGKAWGFGILFVTVISLGSLIGALVVPFMNSPAFQTILMAMISLAVGVLSGSGVFHLIPHALKLGHDDLSYMWKLVMVTVGIYIFFLLESGMKMFLHFRALNSHPNSNELKVNVYVADDDQGHSHHLPSQPGGISHVPEKFPEETPNGVNVLKTVPERKQIAAVAWMILIGDGLHNFIDGLAIGVSCSTSVLSGLATSLAICCEELPHELGDFAILLNSGMTYKQAMLGNFSSACLCFLGLIVGLILGFKTSAVHYIYGLAGGMFLYISLVDMLPESLQMIQCLSGRSKMKAFKLLLIQNFAILFGMGAMLLLSFYAHEIKHAKL